jgi:hypothetical protein
MNNAELLDKVEMLQNLLLAQIRGSNETAKRDDAEYKELRLSVMQHDDIQSLLPRFIRTCRDLMQFWVNIRGEYKHYDEREKFVREQFAPLFDELESRLFGTRNSPSDTSVVTNSPDAPVPPKDIQVSGGVNFSADCDTNIQGDVVGRDKVTSNTTNTTNNYFQLDAIPQSQQPRSPLSTEPDFAIIDAAAVIGSNFRQLEKYLGDPTEVVPLGIGAAEEVPDGGESRTYKIEKYSICVTYDKAGVARGLQVIDGLLENGYSLEHWPVILSRLGMTVVSSPDVVAPAARRWKNYVGYGIMIVANRLNGDVWTARVFKLPD